MTPTLFLGQSVGIPRFSLHFSFMINWQKVPNACSRCTNLFGLKNISLEFLNLSTSYKQSIIVFLHVIDESRQLFFGSMRITIPNERRRATITQMRQTARKNRLPRMNAAVALYQPACRYIILVSEPRQERNIHLPEKEPCIHVTGR